MKLDKDTLVKQHFWILAGLAIILPLAAIFILITVVSAQISKNRKDLETAIGQTKIADPAKNDDWIKEIHGRAEKMKANEKIVWEKAYFAQASLFTWPEEIEKEFDFKKGLFATEIKVDKNAPANDPKSDDQKVIKTFSGILKKVEDKYAIVQDGKVSKIFRPTRNMKVLGGDGKPLNIFVDLPINERVLVTYFVSKYFNDPLTDDEQKAYAKNYKDQIAPIIEKVQPVNAKGEGVVQLRGWFFGFKDGEPILPPENAPFFRYVAKDWNLNGDISEEAWIAQEDLWIQRELYRLVRQANDMVSVLKGEGGKEFGKWYTFTNPYWKMEVNLAGPRKLTYKITNLLPRRQKLDLPFYFTFRQDRGIEPAIISIPGEPIDPNQVRMGEKDIVGPPATGIFRVEQAINWETAAVKRIDHISIGSMENNDICHSNRTFPEGLKPFQEKAKKDAPPGDKNAGPDGLKFPGPMGKFGKQDQNNKLRNGLSPDRYIVVPSAQVRRVPFGIALIIDQEHLDRVLWVISQSPLRILTTQVIINRYPHSLRPNGMKEMDAPKANFGQFQGMMPFGMAPPGLGPRNGFQPNRPVPAGNSNDQESNLELVVYGIASLYQRYPPRPKASTTP